MLFDYNRSEVFRIDRERFIECRTHFLMFCTDEVTVCHVVTRDRWALYVCCA